MINLKELLLSSYWVVLNYSSFKKHLKQEYDIVSIKPLFFRNWHNGSSYFIAQNSNEEVFIKIDRYGRNMIYNENAAFNKFKSNKLNFVVDTYENGTVDGFDYIIQKYQSSYYSLDSIMSKEEIDNDRYCLIINRLSNIINEFHIEEVVHRDIRPENILIRYRDDKLELKIIDFSFMIDSNLSNRKLFKEIEGKNKTETIIWLGDIYKPDLYVWDDGFSLDLINNQLIELEIENPHIDTSQLIDVISYEAVSLRN